MSTVLWCDIATVVGNEDANHMLDRAVRGTLARKTIKATVWDVRPRCEMCTVCAYLLDNSKALILWAISLARDVLNIAIPTLMCIQRLTWNENEAHT